MKVFLRRWILALTAIAVSTTVLGLQGDDRKASLPGIGLEHLRQAKDQVLRDDVLLKQHLLDVEQIVEKAKIDKFSDPQYEIIRKTFPMYYEKFVEDWKELDSYERYELIVKAITASWGIDSAQELLNTVQKVKEEDVQNKGDKLLTMGIDGAGGFLMSFHFSMINIYDQFSDEDELEIFDRFVSDNEMRSCLRKLKEDTSECSANKLWIFTKSLDKGYQSFANSNSTLFPMNPEAVIELATGLYECKREMVRLNAMCLQQVLDSMLDVSSVKDEE